MSCVNKNLKEFKDTVSRLDVHPDNLEVILHKYLNEEDRFPTDPEIMRELRAKPFEATDAEVKFYLKANHQGRKIFGSLSEATRQLNTFKTLYSGNPTIYRNSLGNYVVEAGIPMLKGVPITEGIPFAMDNTTIDQVLQSLDDTNPYHNTFRALVDVLGKENIRIGMEKLRLEDTTMKDKEGKYEDPLAVYGTEGIKFDPFNMRKHLDSNYDTNDTAGRAKEFRRILLHEMTHQLTRRILTSEDNTLRPEELKFKKEIERLYQEALDAIDRKKFPYYGLENIEEFVAEAFSNRDFQRHLNRIKSGKRTLWNKFIGALKSMLDSLSSTSVDNSILYNIIGATSELMVYTKAERERVESERAIMDEIAEETYSELPPDDFFDSPVSRSSGGLYNKLFSLNGVRDGGYSLEKRTWSKGDYMVLNIPTYRTTLKEAIDKGYEILEKQGLSRIDYIVDDKLKEFRGSQYLNVRPRNKVEREQARIKAEKEALEKKDEREAYEEYQLELLTEEENALKGLTQGEIDFINRIEETSPILAQQVLDGLVPFDVAYDIVRNGEQTPYAPSTSPNDIKFYEGNITPDDNTIFVFGSNPTGIHGAGAAKVAREQFGAKAGVGEGLTGNSYALPTKDLNKAKGTRWYRPSQKEEQEVKEWYKNHDYSEVINHPLNQERSIAPQQIIDSIKNLYLEASQHPDKQFKISNYPLDKISLNGYLGYEMLEMFKAAGQIPSNIVFSKTWIDTGRLTKDNFINEETYTEEQETTNQEQQQIKKENQTYMENSVSITQQIDNLNSASILSATEVRHIAEQAVYWISDHITELQEKPGLAEEIYGESLKDKDLSSMSRAEVVRTVGPDAMIALCKEKFSPENTDYDDFDTIEKAEIITDNWGAIMVLASDVFLNVEDFSIVSSKDGKTKEVNEDLVADADNFNSSNMEGDVLENEGDLQEHWQVETKTLDVLTTMSQMVKQALTKCYLLDKDGNKITSEFGINERINVRVATNSILRWTQGALNLEQMISKLKEKADSNPWVRQIIDRLSDTSGKEADFQSQFFGICRHFQSYAVVIEENGKYKSIQVNENPALSEAMTQVTTQYKIGEHPLFTTEGINKEAFNELKSAFKDLEKFNHTGYDLTKEETKEEAARILGYVSNLLGYYVTPDMVAENLNKETFKKMYSALNYITRSLEENLDNAAYEPFKFKSKDGINGNTREFLKPITDHLEDTTVSAFYDSGKMYQSYITPSYTSKLFQKFSQTGKTFDDFLMEEYGKVPWFHTGTKIERGWRNAWLQKLATDSNARKVFKHKVQLNFNKHNYMKNMSDMEYTLSVVTEYFSENASEKQTKVPAWFRVPMLSNKPSSEFIRFYSERGANYKESLTNGFKMIFDQELSRIQTVEMRNLSKEDPRFIKNFDTNGKKFMFLDFMNAYLTGDKKSSELGKLIRQKLDGHKVDEVRLNELAKEAIMQTMEDRAESIVANWEAQGILKGAEKIANIGTSEEEIRENLINFVWNDTFAAMNIMQLTITDIAFYKDAEDLQKRLAQIHAPGVRGNAKATDYEGKPVTDGNFRTIKLKDFDSFISNIIDNVSVVFDRKIDSAPDSEKGALRALKESLVGEDGAFRQINVADAQGYSSPTSYRKKAFVFGKWSREAEEVYQKLRSGTYTYKDLKIAFQPLKPFVYSQITKDAGVKGTPLNSLKVPVQFKNSEYLLIMADAILQNENTGRPNLLRAIFNVMEESHYDKDGNYKTDGIDTVQFESTVKSGLMGKINLNDLVEDPNGETIAKVRMESAIYEATAKEVKEINPETGEEETKTIYERNGLYNNTSVDTVPFEDYCLQQEVPEHFKDHAQVHGSQLRYIIVSELDNFNYFGEPVTYNLEGKQVTAEEFKAEYENTIAENIQDSINELSEELGLNSFSTKDRNISLSKILQREILSSPRYGIDLLQACSVDENGRFRIPLGDPIQSKRVEQLINSVIKNRINKQKIAGGPVVQVTNYGTSKELNIRFKDKEGNLLMTRAEYEKNPIRKEVSQSDKFNARYKKGNKTSSNVVSYKDYIKENQAGIAYFEVFAPIYSNQLFTQFADKNGVINMQALEMLDPDLLKMIGYRIPTEDKYSMAPLKIVGFLPREAGDGIMLPNDITLLTGSDFDVDKEYLMRN